MVRIYTKRRGELPDFTEPIILTQGRGGLSLKSAITQIHRSMLEDFSYAYVWGKSCKFSPMNCGLNHHLCDEDVVQIFKKVTKQSNADRNKGEVKSVQEKAKEKKDEVKKKKDGKK